MEFFGYRLDLNALIMKPHVIRIFSLKFRSCYNYEATVIGLLWFASGVDTDLCKSKVL